MARKEYRLSKRNAENIKAGGLAGRLVELRIATGLSQTFMANYLHINRSTYTYYENGHSSRRLINWLNWQIFMG